MNVLDIDLDFFLNERATGRADDIDSRPDDHGLVPWDSGEVIRFLEGPLHVTGRVPGSVVSSHHEVFFRWRTLIAQHRLTVPFYVCHVDAHADLGMGLPSWVYLHSEFLELPLAARDRPLEGERGLNFGSYLAFAVGNRWISAIDFVVPTFWRDDIPQELLSDAYLAKSGEFNKPNKKLQIELMHAPQEKIESALIGGPRFTQYRRPVGEPAIAFNIIGQDAAAPRYRTQTWDFIFLSHSPGYVPTSADALLPVISAYIDAP
jgi:hypothetical protein